MNSYHLLILLISLSAAFAYLNLRFIKMPFVIGLFFLSTIMSIIILSSKFWAYGYFSEIKTIVAQSNISHFILEIMLGFLLFAGSLHTDWAHIKNQLKPIGLLAVGGVLFSTIIIAMLFYACTIYFGLSVDFIYCLLFGALIAPTDPIAVLGILTKANVPKKIETIVVGESLFNDGVGVVMFIALLETLNSGSNHIDYIHFGTLFLREAIGGVFFGLIFGFLLHKLLKSIDYYEIEVLLTIAFVMAGYSLCLYLHLSGALAMVIMGLFVGNYRQDKTMSDVSLEYVHKFWELLDVILNAFLFIIIGFVLLFIDFKTAYIFISLVGILIVLLSRIIIVYLPKYLVPSFVNIDNKEAKIIVWGGLRGGLSIALVLSLPESEAKQLLMIATYFCVLFSILFQGLTIERFAKRLIKK
jgi:monovalent cation:H+ antiporter, CPA1 family